MLCFNGQENEEVPTKNMGANEKQNMSRYEAIMEKLKIENCDNTQKIMVQDLVNRYPLQFYVPGDKLEVTDVIQHEIILNPDAVRVNLPQRRFPETLKQKMKEGKRIRRNGCDNGKYVTVQFESFLCTEKRRYGKESW